LVGYDDAPLPPEFDELVLDRLNDEEVLEYARKFLSVVANRRKEEAEFGAQEVFRQTTTNASDLRTNPLMLGLMLWIFNGRGDVPGNRPEIYRECAILMFEKWDPDRDIKADIPKTFDKLQLFSDLASKIFGVPECAGGVDEKWLENHVREYFLGIYLNPAQAFEAARSLVKFITGRAWVMSEVGDGTFAFTHQTFLEYFFARHLTDVNDTVKQVYKLVYRHVLKKQWDVVSHLSLQIKTYRNFRKQNEALDLVSFSLTNAMQRNLLVTSMFSSRTLEYLAGSEASVGKIVSTMFENSMARSESGDFDFWEPVGGLTYCAPERRDYVERALVDLFVTAFKSSEAKAHIISRACANDSTSWHRRGRTNGLPYRLKTTVQQVLKDYVLEAAENESFFAGLAFQWYASVTRGRIQKFGLATYFNAPPFGAPEFNGLLAMVFAASSQGRHFFGLVITEERARTILRQFGDVGIEQLPLSRDGLRKFDIHLPLEFWDKAAKELADDQAAQLGLAVALAVTVSAQHEYYMRSTEEARKTKKLLQRVVEVAGDRASTLVSVAGLQETAK